MFISFLVRLNGIKIEKSFDAEGKYLGKVAKLDLENVFNWAVFLSIFLPGLVILGNL